MAEKLKYMYNEEFINKLSNKIILHYQKFNQKKFKSEVFVNNWENLELKERMYQIAIAMNKCLTNNYKKDIEILINVSSEFEPAFEPIVFAAFVELFGMEDYDTSIIAMEEFTKSSSSEFVIRHFIQKYPSTMNKMLEWSYSDNYHVRRLASEGCRPRLPWAIGLPKFKKDPALIIPILENLKLDSEMYVRKSVANNINDISKDNPEIALSLCKKWKNKYPENKEIFWIIKHGLRTLLKSGNKEALKIFGYGSYDNYLITEMNIDDIVSFNSNFNFSFNVESKEGNLGKTRVEYALYFLRKNGRHNKKVFKISEGDLNVNKKKINKNYSFKEITTRKYYEGKHFISIIINGKEFEKYEFILKN